MPKLTKLEVEEGKQSVLEAGYSRYLPFIHLFKYDVPDAKKEVNSVDDVEEGWQIYLSSMTEWMRTSKIKEIVSKSKNIIIFRTQTSLYKLEMEEEEVED